MADAAHRVNVREARRNFRQLLEWVEAGEEVVLLRRDVEVGRIVAPERHPVGLPSRAALRAQIRVRGKPMSEKVIDRRRNERA
ncbi:MAG: type II toxin-antitoxin system Phd/YefM family antitoxin [Terriglobales bacterium]